MLIELMGRGLRRWRPAIGWASLSIASLGIMEADWVAGDVLFLYVTMVGALLSVLLAQSRISGWGATAILVLLGLVYVTDLVSHFLPPLVGAASELWDGIVWLWYSAWNPGWELVPPAFPLWNESGARLLTFGERLAAWGTALSSGQSELNPVAFLFVSGMILWFGTAWAMWAIIRRGRPLLGMLPLGVALSMSTYLSGASVGYVFGFVASLTLLFPILHLSHQEQHWERDGIDYSLEIRLDVWQVAILIMLLVFLLSLITPSFSIPRLLQTFWEFAQHPQEKIEEWMVRFFGGIEPEEPPQYPVRAGGEGGEGGAHLPRSHLLGGNPDLSQQIVMLVETDSPPPMPPEAYYIDQEAEQGPLYYWKGITYDTFTGHEWINASSMRTSVPAYQPVVTSTVTPTLLLRQRFLMQAPHGDTLYATAEAHQVDQMVTSRLRWPGDLQRLEGEINDYVVLSLVPQATVRQLRSVPDTYPEQVAERYLKLPGSLPERVRDLAREVTQNADTAYDKAVAIERYLRQFPYDLEVPPPPGGRDVVDYFLFDAQKGYCDYYSSAFVVMARAVGIPARLAVGYAMGTYDFGAGYYVVSERDGHSWPEVYFGERGWIAFEPTAALRTFNRPLGAFQGGNEDVPPPPIPRRPWFVTLHEWWRRVQDEWTTYAGIGGGVLLLALMIVQGETWRRRSSLSPVEGVALCYQELGQMGEQLGTPRRPYDTPAEYELLLAAALHQRTPRWPWTGKKLAEVVEEAAREVRTISRAYERASYGTPPLHRAYRSHVDRSWRQLRRQLRWLQRTST
jgi:transglutaminase-like putative cysteine protease